MRIEELDARGHELAEEVMTGMREWRGQHPKRPSARSRQP